MAEIRVRDVEPHIITQLQALMIEMRENTISQTLHKLIPRYHDLKKRIAEQEKEIQQLSAEVRQFQMNKNTLYSQFHDMVDIVEIHTKEMGKFMIDCQKMREKFGTKKTRRPAPRISRNGKNVPLTKKKKK